MSLTDEYFADLKAKQDVIREANKMSMWSVILSAETDDLHVAPTENGKMLPPHELSPNCPCDPVREITGEKIIYQHQDPQRGCDA